MHNRASLRSKFIAIPILFLSLAACSLIEGRETSGQYVDDTTLTSRVKEAFIADPNVSAMQINVESMQGVVQLSGFVDSQASEQRAVQLAQQTKGVKRVKDNIVVRPSGSSH